MSIANIVFTELVAHGEAIDPSVHSEGLCAYDALVFSAQCRNEGDRATRGFHVTFRLDDGTEHSERVEGLSPGEEQWVQWRHDAVAEGWHQIHVEFDAAERIRESDENDNAFTYPFHVHAGEADAHSMTFEAETITADVDHAAAGWKQIDVNFVISDAQGLPIRGYNFFAEFWGPQDEHTSGGDTVDDSELTTSGLLRCPDIWLKPEGTVRLTGVVSADGPHEAGPLLEGVRTYKLAEGATSLRFEVTQGRSEIEVEASSAREASEKVTAEGHAGITIEVLEIGGSVGTESGTSHTVGRSIRYKVILGTPALTLTQSP
jgi:hypothetical protein